jgi:hypothetical protein
MLADVLKDTVIPTPTSNTVDGSRTKTDGVGPS